LHSGGRTRTEMLLNSRKVMTRRGQSVFPNQRNELLRRNEKCNYVNETKQAQNDKPGEPIGVARFKKPLQGSAIVHGNKRGMTATGDQFA